MKIICLCGLLILLRGVLPKYSAKKLIRICKWVNRKWFNNYTIDNWLWSLYIFWSFKIYVKQECIPVECIPPARYFMWVSITETPPEEDSPNRTPPRQRPLLGREPSDWDPPLDRDPPPPSWTETETPGEQNQRQV